MRGLIFLIFILSFLFSWSQEEVFISISSGHIYGDLRADSTRKQDPIIYFIGGSGASTKDGIGNFQKNLSETLWAKGVQNLSVDKRGAGKSSESFDGEENFRFDSLVVDAIRWIDFLKSKGYSKIILAGHSQGSLVAIKAAQHREVYKLISLAGTGRTIDLVIKEQLKDLLPVFRDSAYVVLDGLRREETYDTLSPYLYSLLRPSIQPFLISWIKVNPVEEIHKLNIPCLIIQGTTDIQVKVEDAKLLHSASHNSELKIIKGMNHVFRNAPIDKKENQETYTNPSLPANNKLVKSLVKYAH